MPFVEFRQSFQLNARELASSISQSFFCNKMITFHLRNYNFWQENAQCERRLRFVLRQSASAYKLICIFNQQNFPGDDEQMVDMKD